MENIPARTVEVGGRTLSIGLTDMSTFDSGQNIYQLWLKVIEENEKIANLRLAAAQVFQEKISDEAKNLRGLKAVKAKKFIDRSVLVMVLSRNEG